MTQESIDTAMTPTVEIEQPLLEAPEVSDLARHTSLDFALEGMVLTLLHEEEQEVSVSPPQVPVPNLRERNKA